MNHKRPQTVSQERSGIILEQEMLEAWGSLLIYFDLVEVLPLDTYINIYQVAYMQDSYSCTLWCIAIIAACEELVIYYQR